MKNRKPEDGCSKLGAMKQAMQIEKYYRERGLKYEIWVTAVAKGGEIYGIRSDQRIRFFKPVREH